MRGNRVTNADEHKRFATRPQAANHPAKQFRSRGNTLTSMWRTLLVMLLRRHMSSKSRSKCSCATAQRRTRNILAETGAVRALCARTLASACSKAGAACSTTRDEIKAGRANSNISEPTNKQEGDNNPLVAATGETHAKTILFRIRWVFIGEVSCPPSIQ